MLRHLRAHLILIPLTLLVGAVAYPAVLLAVGQLAFSRTANGSLVTDPAGKVVGSSQIAQEFKGDEWFKPRPSATTPAYNAAASGGSNLSANNPKLRERVEDDLKALPTDPPVPADAVTTSGSGLDPHITERNARMQLPGVVGGWVKRTGKPEADVRREVEAALAAAVFRPLFGVVASEPLVNVLELNLDLAGRFQ